MLFLFLFFIFSGTAQTYKVHSHNDYEQQVPFWNALSAGASSIEADVFLIDGKLLVAHERRSIDPAHTLERLYLDPIQESLERGLVATPSLQLLIDVKSDARTTLDALLKALSNYPELTGSDKLMIVISGNRPQVEEYVNYPDFISFDYQSLDPITDAKVMNKIALISLSFTNFTSWNGKGRLTQEDLEKLTAVVKKAHSFNKPFRFWATPDSKTSWKAIAGLGVDYINTDHPYACVQYLNLLPERTYENTGERSAVYQPTFDQDGADQNPLNIILMIGDGNGLAQISAGAFANGGSLSLTQLKNIGFIKTQSSDDFTTDSAGGATAMATGEKVPNRAIGVDKKGKPISNIIELLHGKDFLTAIITTDEITGATPSSFYAHQKDRSMSENILEDLKKSPLDLFVASGNKVAGSAAYFGFELTDNLENLNMDSTKRTGFFFAPEISPAPLDKAVKTVLEKLKNKDKAFFLMVEGAKIDSYGHANNIEGIVKEEIAFDKAITEALKFADNTKNTLVIITADHETGGLTLPQGNLKNKAVEADFTTDDHTGIFIPIFSYGPQSQRFQGVFENNEVYQKIINALGL